MVAWTARGIRPAVRTTHFASAVLASLLTGTLLFGCGSSSKGQDQAQDTNPDASADGDDVEAAVDAAPDGGGMADGYPAFPPAMGQLVMNKGGKTLTSPKIITVTWASDPNASTLQAFDDQIGASTYWKVLSEYGIGPASSAAVDHVVIPDDDGGAPWDQPWADDAIDQWTQSMIAGAPANGWPAPDDQSVYIVFVPPTTKVLDQGQDACNVLGGYHVELNASAGTNPDGVAYALIDQYCAQEYGMPVVGNATEDASHELAEAATDPYPNHVPALVGFDPGSLSWELWNEWQDEVADACESFDEGYYQGGSDLPYMLSRVWSNASGKAGHDPCVPVPSGAYNNVTPLGLETISVRATDANGGVSPFTSKGWHISPGQTATVSVGFYSDAPRGSWSVQAVEGDCCSQPATPSLTVTPATFSGNNGDTVQLSIKVNSAPTTGSNAVLLTFWSAVSSRENHYMPVVIGAY